MQENEIIEEIKEAMEYEKDISLEDKLEALEEWDSLAMLTILGFFHDNNINIEVEDIEKCNTIGDIVNLATK